MKETYTKMGAHTPLRGVRAPIFSVPGSKLFAMNQSKIIDASQRNSKRKREAEKKGEGTTPHNSLAFAHVLSM